jgi:sorbitol-specific phosphotransferase system component IIBC
MRALRKLIAPGAIVAGAVVVLVDVRDGAVDIPTGVVLVVAFAVLARNAIRLVSEPSRRDAPPPPHA